jgi:hypothetical protein
VFLIIDGGTPGKSREQLDWSFGESEAEFNQGSRPLTFAVAYFRQSSISINRLAVLAPMSFTSFVTDSIVSMPKLPL